MLKERGLLLLQSEKYRQVADLARVSSFVLALLITDTASRQIDYSIIRVL